MRSTSYLLLFSLAILLASSTLPPISRDVIILGGGSAGTYAALSLPLSTSHLIIESSPRLGGRSESYLPPTHPTGPALDLGVVILHDTPIVRSYLSLLNIPHKPAFTSTGFAHTIYADFNTGLSAEGPNLFIAAKALADYYNLALHYAPYLSGTVLPIPPELLAPFGEFVKQNNISAALPAITMFSQGLVPLLGAPAFTVLHHFGAHAIFTLFSSGFLSVDHPRGVEAVYDAAAEKIGIENILFSSTVVAAKRGDGGHRLTVETPAGEQIVTARRLIIAIPPTLANLAHLDMNAEEMALFKSWEYSVYYSAVISHPSLPADTILQNLGAGEDRVYAIYSSAIEGLFYVKSAAASSVSSEAVVAAVEAAVDKMQVSGALPKGGSRIDWKVRPRGYSLFGLRVSSEEIASGWWARARALQGKRATWWIGAAWSGEDSGRIWEAIEKGQKGGWRGVGTEGGGKDGGRDGEEGGMVGFWREVEEEERERERERVESEL